MRTWAWAPLFCLLASATPALAEEPMLPTEQQVPLLLKVLTYERTLMRVERPDLRVGVLFDPAAAESRRQFDDLERVFRTYADKTIRGHAVTLVPIPVAYLGKADLPPEAAGIHILYVPPSDLSIVPIVREWTRSRKILSATPVAAYVEAGLSLGLVVRNGRTGVAVNRAASGKEGKIWAEDFLRLCHVID